MNCWSQLAWIESNVSPLYCATLTWNSGPMSTSNPRSANPVAMTLAPLSWPSCPIFATSSRGFLPSCFLNSAILIFETQRKRKQLPWLNIQWVCAQGTITVAVFCFFFTYCGPKQSLHVPHTHCGKHRSPFWYSPCVHQTLPSWHQLFHQPSIWKTKHRYRVPQYIFTNAKQSSYWSASQNRTSHLTKTFWSLSFLGNCSRTWF